MIYFHFFTTNAKSKFLTLKLKSDTAKAIAAGCHAPRKARP
jgi:hypothetical protein